MVVENTGYLKLSQVLGMLEKGKLFGIYLTKKGSNILITDTNVERTSIHHPIKDRLPWKVLEGKTISSCVTRVFNSQTDSSDDIDISNWNNGEQIMSYIEYRPF